MGETIKHEDIDRSHRIAKPNFSKNTKPRLIIVTCVRFNTRNWIYRSKKKLKETGISVTKSLKEKRINMFEQENISFRR